MKRRFSDTVEAGRVISSDPAPGTRLEPDTVVILAVSKGVRPVAVPDIVGKSEGDARAALGEAGLSAAVVDKQFSTEIPEGAVIRQSPADGTAPKGSQVELVISKGPPLVTVAFPESPGCDAGA